MDFVLEVFDTFLADPIYAKVLPVQLSSADNSGNGTLSSTIGAKAESGYVYEPSTKYLPIEPSELAYMTTCPRDNIYRQALSLFIITWIFGFLVYFICASLSYFFVFDKSTLSHPKYLKNQIRLEIAQASRAIPFLSLFTVPIFLVEVRGYTKLYDTLDEAPFPLYNLLQFPLFLVFTDFFIYWIHRALHHPLIYKRYHKPHHKWIIPSPFASHAFHPLDGWSQGLPYHIFPFIFPLQKTAYVFLFVAINIWTVIIHDGEYVANNPIINGAACHTLHHLYFNYNYGQFTTLWDRIGGSYRRPGQELFKKETKMGKEEWEKQVVEVERFVKEVEGEDDRLYDGKGKKDL
ncbi:c-5 sterol desaturase [Arachnomyces sp. PD_36]|nr:c-5 sterol desaturase [Arachnomyces sp. PD_36]